MSEQAEFVWPSDIDRAENDELNRVCEYAEQLEDELQAARQSSEAEPVGEIITDYHGIKVRWYEHPKYGTFSVGTKLYTRPPARVPEELERWIDTEIEQADRDREGSDDLCVRACSLVVKSTLENVRFLLLTHQPSAERVPDIKELLTREGHLSQDAAYSNVDDMTLRERQIAEKWVESIERLARALLKQEGGE